MAGQNLKQVKEAKSLIMLKKELDKKTALSNHAQDLTLDDSSLKKIHTMEQNQLVPAESGRPTLIVATNESNEKFDIDIQPKIDVNSFQSMELNKE